MLRGRVVAPCCLAPLPSPIKQLSNANVSTTKTQKYKQRARVLSRVWNAVLEANGRARVCCRSVFRKAEQCVARVLCLFGEHVVAGDKVKPLALRPCAARAKLNSCVLCRF